MIDSDPRDSPYNERRFALFQYGFRPFFWGAGAFAVFAGVAWMVIYATGSSPLPAHLPQLWHAHEMIYGFIVATIAGFLLTAVPGWTGERGFAGTPLVVLTAVWLVGRIAFSAGAALPLTFVAICDLAFRPPSQRYLRRHSSRGNRTSHCSVRCNRCPPRRPFRAAALVLAVRACTLVVAIDSFFSLTITGPLVPAFTASARRARAK